MKRALFLSSIALLCLFANCKKKNSSTTVTGDTTLYKNVVAYVDTPFILVVPTAFTPNGDGRNDEYRMVSRNLTNDSFLLKVMRSNGDIVFQTTDHTTQWDGSQNGKMITDYKLNVSIRFKETQSGQIVNTTTYLYLLPGYSTSGCMQVPSADISKYFFEDQIDPPSGQFVYPTGERFCN